ncbi:hypothetical protein J3A83DRAFT_4185104 [Scleroderma citrinum]
MTNLLEHNILVAQQSLLPGCDTSGQLPAHPVISQTQQTSLSYDKSDPDKLPDCIMPAAMALCKGTTAIRDAKGKVKVKANTVAKKGCAPGAVGCSDDDVQTLLSLMELSSHQAEKPTPELLKDWDVHLPNKHDQMDMFRKELYMYNIKLKATTAPFSLALFPYHHVWSLHWHVGSIFTRKIQSQVLVPIIPLSWHSQQLALQDTATCTFRALRIAIQKLDNIVSILAKHTDPDGKSQEFTYKETQKLRGLMPISSVLGRDTLLNLLPFEKLSDLKMLEEAVTVFINDFHNESFMHGNLWDVNDIVKDGE